MRNIQRFFWFYLFILTGLWLVADLMVWSSPANFFAWRSVLMQYSGVLGIGVMSAAMVLAAMFFSSVVFTFRDCFEPPEEYLQAAPAPTPEDAPPPPAD